MLLTRIEKSFSAFKKKIIISRRVKSMGGEEVRISLRKERLLKIRKEKENIVSMMVGSWRLKEIKPPTEEEYYKFFFTQPMTIKYLRDTVKKYWG
jgi:hypothetical protein